MEKNTPDLWDNFWNQNELHQDDLDAVEYESLTIRWERIKKIVTDRFGKIDGLKVLEIGGGIGTNGALMAKSGADVSILDYSKNALTRSDKLFHELALNVNLIQDDALQLASDYHDQFDVTMSFGLAEHFVGKDRETIIDAHIKSLKKGGLAFISVPNRHNPPYRLYKFLAQKAGFWGVGEEYPYSRRELKQICDQLNVRDYHFIGDSFWWSLNFVNPIRILKKLLKIKTNYYSTTRQRGSFLDSFFSYSLVLVCRK